MGRIVAIGGGEMREDETLALDKRIIELTGKRRPRALFIGTASSDDPGYYDNFSGHYGDQLGCETDVLTLLRKRPAPQDIAAKIAAADLIYVGGGNTLRMMKLWRRLGVDALLRQAHARGTVLCGISAGAICWFAAGHSDSRSFAAEPGSAWAYIRVRGLGLIDAFFCPHIDGENRLPNFQQFMGKYSQMGLACDDNCALEIVDDTCRVIVSKASAKAYRVYRRGREVVTEILPADGRDLPLADLLTKP